MQLDDVLDDRTAEAEAGETSRGRLSTPLEDEQEKRRGNPLARIGHFNDARND